MSLLSQVTPEDKGKATRLHSQDNVKLVKRQTKDLDMLRNCLKKNVDMKNMRHLRLLDDAPGLPERHCK